MFDRGLAPSGADAAGGSGTPGGGLTGWLPVCLPSACFSAPIPPTRARRALFPAGRGETIS